MFEDDPPGLERPKAPGLYEPRQEDTTAAGCEEQPCGHCQVPAGAQSEQCRERTDPVSIVYQCQVVARIVIAPSFPAGRPFIMQQNIEGMSASSFYWKTLAMSMFKTKKRRRHFIWRQEMET